jgi:hypothetical protein
MAAFHIELLQRFFLHVSQQQFAYYTACPQLHINPRTKFAIDLSVKRTLHQDQEQNS